ncbi:MAG: DUF2298 domain-containing protein [Chloroflexota bacterium]|nr:DUF2298 domain-containing protein [Chloroflexota bacterium]
MLDALIWYIAIQTLGILAFPATFLIFKRLPDRGFTLIKPAALIFFSYVLWMLGLSHIAPNSQITLITVLVVAVPPSIFLLRKNLTDIKDFIRQNWCVLASAEILFLGFFLIWLAIISEVPAINHTEKPMDFAFMNAVLQSRYFPPEDPWLSGNAISYYYFGHFIMAFVTQLSGVSSNIGYNLSVALVPALVAVGTFGLIYNLVRLSGGTLKSGIIFGSISPVLIFLAGNLAGAMEFIHVQDWGSDGFWEWIGIKGLDGSNTGSGLFPDNQWWWFRASRVIDTLSDGQSLDYTITEFPIFSFILGDLHPHMISLPFVVLGLGLILNLYLSNEKLGLAWFRHNTIEAAGLAIFIGSLAFINIWDLPVIAGLLCGAALIKAYGDYGGNLTEALVNTATAVGPILILGVMLFLPFYGDFEAQTSGILPLRDVNTRPISLFLVMGLWILLASSFLIRQIPGLSRPSEEDNPGAILIMVIIAIPLLMWITLAFVATWIDESVASAFGEVGKRMILVIPGLILVAGSGFSALQRSRLKPDSAVTFTLLLSGMAFFLLVGAETFYVIDQFGGAFRRMNTVFKFYYQAWLLMGIVGVYGIYYIWSARSPVMPTLNIRHYLRAGKYLWLITTTILIVSSFYYPVGAVLDRTGLLKEGHTLSDNTLDGLSFLKRPAPGEYSAIQWLRDDAPWGRMVEAVGDDYTEFGRISSSTGLPTILGWKGHELQWRRSSSFQGREEDVKTIFSNGDPGVVRSLLETYDVRYVYVGSRELQTYGAENLAVFADNGENTNRNAFLRTAFEQDGVIIYEMIQANSENR